MEEKILNELRQVSRSLFEIIGTEDQPAKQKFSKEAIAKEAKEYRKLSIERGKWIQGYEVER